MEKTMGCGVDERRRPTRRRFLQAAVAGSALAGAAALGVPAARARGPASRFSRMFPNLPPFAEPSPQLADVLLHMGRAGGPMDARDPLHAGPVALILDPALRVNNPDAAMPGGNAGTTFVGQFIDHDMTFDVTSRLGVATPPGSSPNARSAALDLDSVYGAGPVADPLLYDPTDPVKFNVETGGQFEDLPRTAAGRAIVADPRNDENLVIAGLQTAFLLFHNRVVDHLRARGVSDPGELFVQARQLVTWHYQWIVMHEILPSFIGQALVNEILARGHHGRGNGHGRGHDVSSIPVEFQGAAYRFGHSAVRPSYRANLRGDNGVAFFGMVFDPAGEGSPDPVDLRGGCRARRRFIGWQTFFDFNDGEVKPRKRIDTRISTPLFNLPLPAIADGTLPTSLPQRNLLRHLTWQLPSGQHVAEALGVPRLSRRDLAELSDYGIGLDRSTPLWYYVLKEAAVVNDGQFLGPVGGRIVGETIIGILRNDRDSYLAASPRWMPTLPTRAGDGNFRMVDLLTFARVDPGSRGQ